MGARTRRSEVSPHRIGSRGVPRKGASLPRLLLAAGILSLLVAVLAVGWLRSSGRRGGPPDPGPPPVIEPARGGLGSSVLRVQPANALATLETLPVKGRAPRTGYDRAAFGAAWLDADANGCDTRNDILRRDLDAVQLASGSACLVAAGTLPDPYTGHTLAFTRGPETSGSIQIDHVVALSNAWQTGAQQLTAVQRSSLANDPLNLLAVDGPANQDKGDGDAATWLPSSKAFRCAYVARQISVKAAYALWVTAPEKAAMQSVLRRCPDQRTQESGYQQ